MKQITEDHEFRFPNRCPYCQGDLVLRAEGWEEDDHGWVADQFDVVCSSDPGPDLHEEWREHLRSHSDMPYVYWHPVISAIKNEIAAEYRYIL